MVYKVSSIAPYTAKLTILYGSRSSDAMVTSAASPATDNTVPTRWVTLLNRSPICIEKHPHCLRSVSCVQRLAHQLQEATNQQAFYRETGCTHAQTPTGLIAHKRCISVAPKIAAPKKKKGAASTARPAPFTAFY